MPKIFTLPPRWVRGLLLFALYIAAPSAVMANPLNDTISNFIRQQTSNLAGEVSFTIGQIEGENRLPLCNGYQAFFPNGGQQIGNTTVGVRCLMPNNWTVYVPVKIRVVSTYILSSHGLAAGQVLTTNDLHEAKGDIANLPPGIILKREQAIGKTARFSIAAGQALRSEQLMAPLLVRQNQTIRLLIEGPGFKATTEGKALNNASEGQVVQVRTPSGSTIAGIVQADGTASVAYSK